jgi:hypothetical protein
MIDVQDVKQKILNFIEEGGPTIPVKIAKEIKMDPVWASAILAELVNSKKIIMSSMRWGSTSFYLKPGQEEGLVLLADEVLSGIPKDAFLLLRKNKVLKDILQDPQIRVALRSLKDFATPFEYKDEIYWRYNFEPKENVESLLVGKENVVTAPSQVGDEVSLDKVEELVTESAEEGLDGNHEDSDEDADEYAAEDVDEDVGEGGGLSGNDVENILEESNETALVDKVRKYLGKECIVVLEETDIKKKEFLGIGRIRTVLGEMELTILARDKKNINEKDIERAYELVNEYKRVVLFLTTGDFVKKTKEFYRDYKNLIRVERLD